MFPGHKYSSSAHRDRRKLSSENVISSRERMKTNICKFKSQSHKILRVGRDLKDCSIPKPPAIGRDTSHLTRLLKALSNLASSPGRVGASTTSLSKQCLTTLTVKHFFLTSNLNFFAFSLKTILKGEV